MHKVKVNQDYPLVNFGNLWTAFVNLFDTFCKSLSGILKYQPLCLFGPLQQMLIRLNYLD